MNIAPVSLTIEILLVEDNPGDVFLTRAALQQASVSNNLHVVSDGEEAIAFLNQQGQYVDVPRPDMIILDLNLPRKNGREVLKEVKKNSKFKRIPVVVLTSSNSEDDILNCYDSYANCYICKPFNLDNYTQAIETIEKFWLSLVQLPKS